MSAQARGLGRKAADWQRETNALGMWVFLSTEVMFFGVLFLAYFHGRMQDARGFALGSHLTHPWLGTINTALLLTSSLTMALAVRGVWLGQRRVAARFLWATACLGAAFLAVKAIEYAAEWRDGLVPWMHFGYAGDHASGVETFFYLYFVMTGVHALHLALGIAAVLWLATRLRKRAAMAARADAIEAAGLYWHFVDGIWIFLYPLIYLVELWR